MARYPLSCCDPVIIGRHIDQFGPEHSEVWSGSGTLMNLRGRDLLVTMHHNLEIYREKHKEDPRTIFQFSSLSFDPLERLISDSEGLDLCVIDVTGLPIHRPAVPEFDLPALRVFRPSAWPPSEVKAGDVVFFADWPGAYREQFDDGRELLHYGSSFIGIPVTGGGGDQFNCRFDRSNWQVGGGGRSSVDDREMGGFSGCPVFRDSQTGVLKDCDLVGFVKEYNENYDLLIASSAINVTEDGALSSP
jgi:hypothetical protein